METKSIPWSNITDQESGATGSAIGTGQANTAAIIAQTGHESSGALICANHSETVIIQGTESGSEQISINGYYEADFNT